MKFYFGKYIKTAKIMISLYSKTADYRTIVLRLYKLEKNTSSAREIMFLDIITVTLETHNTIMLWWIIPVVTRRSHDAEGR